MILKLLIGAVLTISSFVFAAQKTVFFLMPCYETYNNNKVAGHRNSKTQPLEWAILLQFKDGMWTGINKERINLIEATLKKELQKLGVVYPLFLALTYEHPNYSLSFEWLADMAAKKGICTSPTTLNEAILKELGLSGPTVLLTIQALHDANVKSIKDTRYIVEGPIDKWLLTSIKNEKNWNRLVYNLNDREEILPWITKGSIMLLTGVSCPHCTTSALTNLGNDLAALARKIH